MATKNDLLDALTRTLVARPADLRSSLGISQPRFSRLVAEAGEELVCRMGRGRATRYARTRSVRGLGHEVPLFRVSEAGAAAPCGTLHLLRGGQHWLEQAEGGRLFAGLPPALSDMAPQGYLGRGFSGHFPELDLPPNLSDWSDDHRLIALARRGEGCVGDLILGDESLGRFIAWSPLEVARDEYPRRAEQSAREPAGSSAGGERPKFGAFSRGRHVLVKFTLGEGSPAERRWRDLLWCEWKALETVAAAGVPAARAEWLDVGGARFLEVDRFDRIGARGRRAVLTLGALDDEYFGGRDNWTAAAGRLSGTRPFLLSVTGARQLRWLDTFGQLIGNTDRHAGNVAFLVGPGEAVRLAPAYDMVPMILAPSGDTLAARAFQPEAPTGKTLDVWPDAAAWAGRYWHDVAANDSLEPGLRAFARGALDAVAALATRVTPSPEANVGE